MFIVQYNGELAKALAFKYQRFTMKFLFLLLTIFVSTAFAGPLNENEEQQLVQYSDGNVLVFKCLPGAKGLVELVFINEANKTIYPAVIRCGVGT